WMAVRALVALGLASDVQGLPKNADRFRLDRRDAPPVLPEEPAPWPGAVSGTQLSDKCIDSDAGFVLASTPHPPVRVRQAMKRVVRVGIVAVAVGPLLVSLDVMHVPVARVV